VLMLILRWQAPWLRHYSGRNPGSRLPYLIERSAGGAGMVFDDVPLRRVSRRTPPAGIHAMCVCRSSSCQM
jgi:hypothetical protein